MTESTAKECKNCGHTLHPDSAYCGVCGTPSRDPDQPVTSRDEPWGDEAIAADDDAEYQDELSGDLLADMGTRTGAFAINLLVPGILGLIPFLGFFISVGWSIGNLILYQRGQDIAAKMLKIRVMRSNGDVAGFYHMWSRNLASIISLIPFLAGFWTAYGDAENRTWHDKMLDTYVIQDNELAAARPGTSSSAAKGWFFASIIFVVGLVGVLGFTAVVALRGFA